MYVYSFGRVEILIFISQTTSRATRPPAEWGPEAAARHRPGPRDAGQDPDAGRGAHQSVGGGGAWHPGPCLEPVITPNLMAQGFRVFIHAELSRE